MKIKTNINKLQSYKGDQKIIMITAYDALFASIFNDNADIILVGDSLSMSFGGNDDTLSVTIKDMIYHTQAVCRGAPSSFVVCDMPFGTYSNKKEAFKNAKMIYQQTCASAIKIEGGEDKADIIRHLTQNSIAVMGHIGLLPQDFRIDGYRVKGDDKKSKIKLLKDAKALQEAGAFALVLEGIKKDVAKEITQSLSIPTIGIGAGADVDGQVLVWSDMFGFFKKFSPKFVRKYVDGASIIEDGFKKYIKDVKSGNFPSKDECYG